MYGCVVRVKATSLGSYKRSTLPQHSRRASQAADSHVQSRTAVAAGVAGQEGPMDSSEGTQQARAGSVTAVKGSATASVSAGPCKVGVSSTPAVSQATERATPVLCNGDVQTRTALSAHPETTRRPTDGVVIAQRLQQGYWGAAVCGATDVGAAGSPGSPASPPFLELSAGWRQKGDGSQLPSDRWDGSSNPQVRWDCVITFTAVGIAHGCSHLHDLFVAFCASICALYSCRAATNSNVCMHKHYQELSL